ncbi:lipoyl(octanoyl) transferase LipB [Candidatus Vesicomyidisocius calyptogenae]|uniref:Octanoyltransferase n=1 Tax=Vesicomyosocius okutanii subsp. Calyptogena okutanii (strain HA) TaxID=412965 RepID=LIPB_VESOH|nr:lipoyl(octanoyl) transferase LipB [Candidatus Vesicomyosocius okutanii]A5CWR5.1 RecName: Full=Octanoyltransferase; AltName: Full=Lipoate-protein ligase B; AltName: Full=Lipoyl/octanoyl transferase; AltName: Full=Octanoyl-[acyl-carrier-protein]-protein N-octanoyltransferase [Candidatus Vesicomyosocius okutanii]BAF61616.1 lipoate-protein ligase B [Candidatus Vesicomyosocius okutanii]
MRVINLGRQDYLNIWDKMKTFTNTRDKNTKDELWIVEHNPVFTQGVSSKPEHILSNTDIPIVQTDRGGQVTYHGPGQVIIYCLFDLKRLGMGVKRIIEIIENSIIDLLRTYTIKAHLKSGAPGVYIDNAKIAALGLRIKQSRIYHGLSLNIDMDLSPFIQINPCGYQNLKVTQLCDLTDSRDTLNIIAKKLSQILINYVSRNRH